MLGFALDCPMGGLEWANCGGLVRGPFPHPVAKGNDCHSTNYEYLFIRTSNSVVQLCHAGSQPPLWLSLWLPACLCASSPKSLVDPYRCPLDHARDVCLVCFMFHITYGIVFSSTCPFFPRNSSATTHLFHPTLVLSTFPASLTQDMMQPQYGAHDTSADVASTKLTMNGKSPRLLHQSP